MPVLGKDDLFSIGVVGLIEAYHRFDPSRGIRFKDYAKFRIKGDKTNSKISKLKSFSYITLKTKI